MENKKKKYPSKISLILWIVVAAYLLYLVWELRGAPVSHSGMQKLFFIAAMMIFTVVAVLLGGYSLRAYIRGEYDRPENEDDLNE